MDYAIVLYMDNEKTAMVNGMIKEIALECGSDYCLGVVPHVTISAVTSDNEEAVKEAAYDLSKKLTRGKLKIASIGVFNPLVIFLAPIVDSYLIESSQIARESRVYYENAIANNFHTAYLVFDGVDFVGTGGISYYTVMPTFHNPTGKKAYIMNMYTKPDHRRMGIATRTLELLIQDAKQHGITSVSLEATDIGRKLYESYGFVSMTSEMEFLIV